MLNFLSPPTDSFYKFLGIGGLLFLVLLFYNYFESNGWLVEEKTKMKNWKAAARNWMLNAKRFEKPESAAKSNLHVNENKRYDISL